MPSKSDPDRCRVCGLRERLDAAIDLLCRDDWWGEDYRLSVLEYLAEAYRLDTRGDGDRLRATARSRMATDE